VLLIFTLGQVLRMFMFGDEQGLCVLVVGFLEFELVFQCCLLEVELVFQCCLLEVEVIFHRCLLEVELVFQRYLRFIPQVCPLLHASVVPSLYLFPENISIDYDTGVTRPPSRIYILHTRANNL